MALEVRLVEPPTLETLACTVDVVIELLIWRDTIGMFLGMADKVWFDTLHIVADGPIVMTERIDHFAQGDRDIALPVMGTFEVRDGKITAWRDYFDMNQFTTQMSPE